MTPSTLRCGAALLALFLGGFAPVAVEAHPAYLTVAEVKVEDDGRFNLSIRFDTLAFALNDTSARIGNAPMEELIAGPRAALDAALLDAKDRFSHGFRVATDQGPGAVDTLDFPDAAKVLAWAAKMEPVLPVVLPVELSGRLPVAAKSVTFRFPPVLAQVVMTAEVPGQEPLSDAVEDGMPSTPFPLALTAPPRLSAPPATPSGSPKQNHIWAVGAIGAGTVLLVLLWLGKRAYPRKVAR